MNPAKSQVKAGVYEELGREYEEREKATTVESHQQHGARDGLKLAAGRVGELGNHVAEEMKEGVIEGLAGEPLKIEAYVMKWIKRAVGVCDNLATTAEVARINAVGKAKGLEMAKEHAFKLWKQESAQLSAYAKALEEGRLEEGDDGHPGESLKAQRQAEDAEKPEEPRKEEPQAKPKGPRAPNPLAGKGKKAAQPKKAAEKPKSQKKRLRDPKKKR